MASLILFFRWFGSGFTDPMSQIGKTIVFNTDVITKRQFANNKRSKLSMYTICNLPLWLSSGYSTGDVGFRILSVLPL
jgi:hypothetical protein